MAFPRCLVRAYPAWNGATGKGRPEMGITRRLALAGLAAAPLAPTLPTRISAQPAEWPTRPVRFVEPYPPGGPTDIVGRVVAQRLTQDLPQPVVVENRTGAGGSIGSEQVARAAP